MQGQGGYFFFVSSTTSAMIETKSVPKRNSSSYVTIGTALLSGGKRRPPNKRGATAYRVMTTPYEGYVSTNVLRSQAGAIHLLVRCKIIDETR